MSNGFVQGTTHITCVRKKGVRRERKKCIYYNGDGDCGSTSRCIGSAHCSLYITEEEYEKKKKKELLQKQKKMLKLKKEKNKK